MKTRSLLFSVLSLLLLSAAPSLAANMEMAGSRIQWMTNYDKAVTLSKQTSKPIVLFFTGSDWCGWCTRLEKEVLDTSDFAGFASDKLIFVKLDFPMRTAQDPAIKQQNDELKKRFAIKGFPTLVILDPEEQPIGTTGYRAGGGKQYALHLKKMVEEHTAYKKKMQNLGASNYSGKDLKRLYQKAHELGLEGDVNLLIRAGLDSDMAYYFATERYRYLVDHGLIGKEEAASLKERLLTLDPDNKFLSHYQLAVIDYEYISQNQEDDEAPPEKVISPLLDYIQRFGADDKDNVWRLNMIISQVYLEKDSYTKALKFAEESYASAPPAIQPEIALAIKNIKQQMN